MENSTSDGLIAPRRKGVHEDLEMNTRATGQTPVVSASLPCSFPTNREVTGQTCDPNATKQIRTIAVLRNARDVTTHPSRHLALRGISAPIDHISNRRQHSSIRPRTFSRRKCPTDQSLPRTIRARNATPRIDSAHAEHDFARTPHGTPQPTLPASSRQQRIEPTETTPPLAPNEPPAWWAQIRKLHWNSTLLGLLVLAVGYIAITTSIRPQVLMPAPAGAVPSVHYHLESPQTALPTRVDRPVAGAISTSDFDQVVEPKNRRHSERSELRLAGREATATSTQSESVANDARSCRSQPVSSRAEECPR